MGFSLKLYCGFAVILITTKHNGNCEKIPYHIGDAVVMVEADTLSAIQPFYKLLKSGLTSQRRPSSDELINSREIEKTVDNEPKPQVSNPSLPFAVNDESLLDIKIYPGSTSSDSMEQESVSGTDVSDDAAKDSLIKQYRTDMIITKDEESEVHRVLQENFDNSEKVPEVVSIKREQFVKQGLRTLTVRGRKILMNETVACGLPQIQRIIGGKVANIKQHPWMVQILFKKTKTQFCGGTIINDRYILTAAHCLNFITANKVLVRVEHTRPGRKTQGRTVEPEKFIVHAKYKDSVIERYDIGLIKLKQSLQYSDKALPICLTPKADSNVNGLNGVITGWGIFEESSRSPSDVLREAFVKISDEVKCKKESSYKAWELNESVVCASETKIDSCQGDSGGPLSYVVKEFGVYSQAGITSWGLGCARKRYPGVYTEVSHYYDWILKHTPDAVWSCFGAWNRNCKNHRRVQPIRA